jgi:hypothetical protein
VSLEAIELSIFGLLHDRMVDMKKCQLCAVSNRITKKGCKRYRELACAAGGQLVHQNGQIAAEGPYLSEGLYKDRRRDGDWTFYAMDGSIVATGQYGDGARIWKFFDANGEILQSWKFCPRFGRQDVASDCPVFRGQIPSVVPLRP